MGNQKKNLDKKLIEKGVEKILEGLGIDWKKDENFKETPKRVARMMEEFCQGLYENQDEIKIFRSKYSGIILCKDIKTVGICPHHLLPVEYKISFAYIPTKYVLGLSKIVRIITKLSKRPVLQEDLTNDIINYFQKKLRPLGCSVIIKGVHGCMKFRGVKQEKEIITSRLEGVFYEEIETRNELYQLLNL